jgi:hypothetical protein
MAAPDQIPGQEFEYVALRWNFFFFPAVGHRDRWNELRDKHILFSGEFICSRHCLVVPVEHPDLFALLSLCGFQLCGLS